MSKKSIEPAQKLASVRIFDFVDGLKQHKISSEEARYQDRTSSVKTQVNLELQRSFRAHQNDYDIDILIVPKLTCLEEVTSESLQVLLTHSSPQMRAIGMFMQQLLPDLDEPPF